MQATFQCIIPFVPTEKPRLDHVVYEMVLAHFLSHDRNVSISFSSFSAPLSTSYRPCFILSRNGPGKFMISLL